MRQEVFEKFVMQNRKKYDAFNLSAAFTGRVCEFLQVSMTEMILCIKLQLTMLKIHCQRPAKAGGQQLPLCAQLQLSAHPSGRTGHPAPCYQCDAA